jgi:phosphatidylcholine synthase
MTDPVRTEKIQPDRAAPAADLPHVWPLPARLRAFTVHIFTACGAGLALLALLAAHRGQWTQMFIFLGIALIIDGLDGILARHFRVTEVLPNWSGDALDFVVDFVTYVFVPAYALATGDLLPPALAVPLGVAVVISSALYFADRRMKTADNYFRGFPVLWNAAAFYLFLFRPAPWTTAGIIALLIVLTFVPFRFVHPMRVRRLRALNVALVIAYGALAALALVYALDPGPIITMALAAMAVYFCAIGLIPDRK